MAYAPKATLLTFDGAKTGILPPTITPNGKDMQMADVGFLTMNGNRVLEHFT
jgi:predicted ester cyclase